MIIKGKYLSSKNREYIKLGIYDQIHSLLIKKYTSIVDSDFINLLHTDTSFVENKRRNIKSRNKYCSRKTGLKISTLLDDNRTPLFVVICTGNRNDSDLLDPLINNTEIANILKNLKICDI